MWNHISRLRQYKTWNYFAVQADPISNGSSSYIEVPVTRTAASSNGWVNISKPEMPTGYETFDLYCKPGDYNFGLFFDATGNVMGAQFAVSR